MSVDVMRVQIVQRSIPNDSRTGADQWLLRDSVTGDHYVASGVNAFGSGWEVLVFPSDEKGAITDWGEVAGGRDMTHQEAIADLEERLNG